MGVFVQADFVIIQRAANPYALKSETVYDLNIISSETQAVHIKLYGTVRKDGKEVVQLESRPVAINPGANALSAFNVSSQRKNYLNKNILEIEQLTTTLPPGNYEICVYLRCATADCNGLGRTPFDAEAVYCQQVKVEPPTPLLLSYPEDGAKLKIKKPTLSYIPPGPIAASSKLSYTITLVKLNKGQNKVDGIKRNRPLLRKTGHSLTSLMYPLDLADLEVGEKYAWQVEAWVGDQWISTSEVWEFEVVEEEFEDEEIPKNQSYINIKEQDGEAKYFAKGVLKINYETRMDMGEMQVSIYKTGKSNLLEDTLQINSGQNYYDIQLKPMHGFVHKQKYTATIQDAKNRTYTIHFFYVDPSKIKTK